MRALQSRMSRLPGAIRDVSPREIAWSLPVLLAAVYAIAAVLPNLGTIINHTWWSADSIAAGFIGQLWHLPAAGQYVIIGDHGWYEAAAFYLLTRVLPAHRAVWYVAPLFFWALTIALLAVSAARAFGRYAGSLVTAALLCLAPTGLMVIFQPTAHTNAIFHAAVLVLVATFVIPRTQELSLRTLLLVAIALGLFSGLPAAGDSIALVWGAIPFAVAVGLSAWRGPGLAARRTIAFGLVTLVSLVVAAAVFGSIMQGFGFRIDELDAKDALRFATVGTIGTNFKTLVYELQYLVGGDFFGQKFTFQAVVDLVTAVALFIGVGAVAFVTRREVAAGGQRAAGGSARPVSPRLVYVAFWSTCLVGGVVMFLIGSPGTGVSRYLVGPLVAVAALLPLAAARGQGWRILVAAGISVVAVAGVIRVDSAQRMPLLPGTEPLGRGTIYRVERFAEREHATFGYAAYYDAMTLSWFTGFHLQLHEVRHCGPFKTHYCPEYQVAFTSADLPRPGIRTLFIADPFTRFYTPDPRWGKPLASKQIGRLTVYVYSYDIASRFPKRSAAEIQQVITGNPRAA